MNTDPTRRRTSWLIFAGLMAVLLLLAVQRPLALPDEGRYGEVGRWMLQSGDFLAPRLNGLPFFTNRPCCIGCSPVRLPCGASAPGAPASFRPCMPA